MAHTSVSSCVLSIIASFSSGLNVIKRLREKQKRKHKRKASGDEELRLSRSLRKGPEDIGWEYQTFSQRMGDQYAVGDAAAQSSLAEILLRLNTGLVGIITTFLHRDKHGNLELDYRSLTDLSEQSREQTVGVLRQLYQRMLARRSPARSSAVKGKPSDGKAHRSSRKHSRVRGPTLARVVIRDSSKPSQIALVRPAEVKRSARPSSQSRPAKIPGTPPLSQASTAIAASQLSLPPTLPPDPSLPKPARPGHTRSKTSPPELAQKPSRRPRKHQADLDLGETLRATQSTPKLVPATLPARRRKETPTFYSAASGSTKLGEIPMHKWAEAYDFDAMSLKNREAMAAGWPRLLEEEDAAAEKKKRGGIFRLFRRREAVAA